MRKPLVPPPNMVEQDDLRSGPIERSGFPDYGIIFATYDQAKATDFDIANLEGATLVNPAIPGVEGHFTILGGYFAKRGNNAVAVSQVFGDALDKAKGFGLTDGKSIVGDNWVMQDIGDPVARKSFLDERSKGKDGWTFLVTHKPLRSEYPFSGKSMEIYTLCPEISIKHHRYSIPEKGFVEVEVTLEVTDGPASNFTWDFGDGSQPVKTKIPSAKHKYKQSFDGTKTYTITVKSDGPGDCVSQTSLPVKIAGQDHPALASVAEVSKKKVTGDDKKVTIDFEAKLVDPKTPHDTYTWDFGDGSPPLTSKNLKETHVYTKGPAFLMHTVSVEGKGPEKCESTVSTKIILDPKKPPCPVIGKVVQTALTNIGTSKTQFNLKAEFTGKTPTQFVWSWISEGKEYSQTTKTAELTVVLDRTAKDNRPVIINLHTFGPFDCRGKSQICVNVPGIEDEKPCPAYMKALPYFLALVWTMLVSAVITCYPGENLGQADGGAGIDWMYTWTIIISALGIVSAFVWLALGKKSACGPRICSILMILSTVLIGSAVFTLLIGACFENFIPLFVILLLLGIGGIVYFLKTCKDKMTTNQVLIFVAMGVLGVVLAIAIQASPALVCI